MKPARRRDYVAELHPLDVPEHEADLARVRAEHESRGSPKVDYHVNRKLQPLARKIVERRNYAIKNLREGGALEAFDALTGRVLVVDASRASAIELMTASKALVDRGSDAALALLRRFSTSIQRTTLKANKDEVALIGPRHQDEIAMIRSSNEEVVRLKADDRERVHLCAEDVEEVALVSERATTKGLMRRTKGKG